MKWNEWWTANYPDGAGYSISEVSWNAALEEAAKVCEEHDEAYETKDGKRILIVKTSNNLNGTAYAKAIRALKT